MLAVWTTHSQFSITVLRVPAVSLILSSEILLELKQSHPELSGTLVSLLLVASPPCQLLVNK